MLSRSVQSVCRVHRILLDSGLRPLTNHQIVTVGEEAVIKLDSVDPQPVSEVTSGFFTGVSINLFQLCQCCYNVPVLDTLNNRIVNAF